MIATGAEAGGLRENSGCGFEGYHGGRRRIAEKQTVGYFNVPRFVFSKSI
jgi:hypothetical protein